jgi:hypothetical protein
MALIGIDNTEFVEFVSSLETDKDNPTVFKIGLITNRQKMKFLSSESTSVARIGDIMVAGLKGIKNLKFKDKSINIDAITEDIIDLLPMDILMEVVNKVLEFNDLSKDETKN